MGYFKNESLSRKRRSGIYIANSKEVLTKVQRYAKDMTSKEAKRIVLREGVREVTSRIRKLSAPRAPGTPKSRSPHYYYSKGIGNMKVKILSGNLLKSTKYYFRRKLGEYEVGPKVLFRLSPEWGRTVSKSSGYYASMVYGSASAYRIRVMEPELNKPATFQRIEKAFARYHKKLTAKYDT